MYQYIGTQSVSSVLSQTVVYVEIKSFRIIEDKKEKEKFTEYLIEITRGDEHWGVRRRYNEFVQLNDKIKKLYPEIKLKLPKKKLFGDNFDKEFLTSRQKGLNEFLQEAMSYPNIVKMPTMADFLEIRSLVNVSLNEENEDLEAYNNLSNSNHSGASNNDSGSSAEQLRRSNSDEINLGPSHNPIASPKDFEYLSVIGKGSFGKVYMARHKEENKIYAIKILQKSAVKKRNEVKHIMAERNVLVRNINHPFLVALYYSFQTNDKLYFVLDYVNGGELFFHLQRQRIFTENRSKFYTAEMSHAIGYLHSKNIIYRDLKPENILIDSQGHVRLTDFGLCKEGIEANTTTSTFCGTPEYLAPEIILKRPYTRAVDWWCLGSVLYEMLYGLPPFYSRDTSEMYNNILTKPLRLNPSSNVSPSARHLIEGLLQKEENQRLGYSEDDFREIQTHPFFASIDWVLLLEKRIEPPWKPNLTDRMDLKHIDPEFTQENISSSVYGNSLAQGSGSVKDTTFNGFTYVNDYTLNNFENFSSQTF